MHPPEHHRLDLAHAACELSRQGLNRGTAGSVGMRHGSGFLVTPSGVPACDIFPTDVVEMTMEGRAVGSCPPSSEWRIHRDILAHRPEVNAVLHTHAPFSVTLSCVNRAIPPFHHKIAVAGGRDIRCASYATFDSQDLARNVLDALKDRKACLMAQHGMIALGDSLKTAMTLAVEVEELAEQYWRILQIGEPGLLPDTEIDTVLRKLAGHGGE